MDIVVIDYETFWDTDFSLSKLQTDEYVLDDKYETMLVCVKKNDEPVQVIYGDELAIAGQLQCFTDWSNACVVAHNCLFDGFIASQRHGIKPRMWLCTLAMARMVYPYLRSFSLAKLAKFLKLQDKGDAVLNMKGVRRADMTPEQFAEYAEYCKGDVDICHGLYKHLDEHAPLLNKLLLDMTIRMFTEPKFEGDKELIAKLHRDEVARKEGLLAMAAVDRSEIMSNNKFAEKLRALGVVPPTKISPRTNKETFAFAKTDKGFQALLDHPDSDVVALVEARMGAKTTIAETRALRFLEMARRGPLPVYLQYWGAKTTGRYSGGNKVNWQNLPARGISAGLRYALKAPEGYKVVVGDSSNIELRTVMALAGEEEALQHIREGRDMYCHFASSIYGREITKADKAERFLGKTAMLGLQYGAGAPRFHEMVRVQSRGIEGAEPIDMQQAERIVFTYRDMYSRIVALWKHCDNLIPRIANREYLDAVDKNGWFITQREGFGRPGEPGVVYHDLRYDHNTRNWLYKQGRDENKVLYGAKMVENLCQHAAMQIVMWQTARVHQKYPVKLSVHDEMACVVPEDQAEDCRDYMLESLSMTPAWVADMIPVEGEVAIGGSYGDAK
jgi:DNA polymerase